MSLFKTKEWWQTRCGANEIFDRHSLSAAPLFGEERKDILIVGSHEGYLRMYSPSSEWIDETRTSTNYKSTDLILEIRVGDCVVDTKVGKFVSGSQGLHLAVVTGSKLMVYSALLTDGPTEYGDRCDLKLVYEHALPKFPASLTTGPFGGVRGREFLCVQCLDGTLLFYEQEVFAFSQVLGNRLLAEPIVYVSRYDLFITASSSWFIECYRYQSMAEWSRSKEQEDGRNDGQRANLEPDCSYNVGEAVLAIEAVTLTSFEVGIVVLGERHLYCLKDNCTTVKYAKRLEYRPVCCRAYVIEPDGKLMVLVIADTNTLLVYEGSTVKWSAQLPFPPVTVARVQLQHMQGVIVVLSEDGRLEACYLGSEPSLFVAPPLHPRGYDYAAAEQRLSELRNLLNKSKDAEDRTCDAVTEAELTVSMNASIELESSRVPSETDGQRSDRTSTNDGYDHNDDETRPPQPSCTVAVELSSYGSLNDVQVCVDVDGPLIATNTFYAIPTLCERHVTKIGIRVNGRMDLPPISSDVRVTVSYRTAVGNLRALRRTAQLPLNAILRTCPPADNASTAFAAVIKSVDPLPGFGQLFPEFSGDQWQRQGWSTVGLRHAHSGRTVTVVSCTAGNRYRVQASDGLSATLVVQRLADRFGGRPDRSRGMIGTHHLQLVQQRIEAHFAARREIERITNEIGLLTSQLRNVERRMLRTVRERAERSLSDTGLPFLFDATCREIFSRLRELGDARAERERLGHELRCSLRLLLLLLRLNLPDEEYAALRAAIDFDPRPSDRLDWEEIADATLTTLLKSTSRKSAIPEAKSSARNALSPIATKKELGKLKKRLVHAIERLDGSKELDIAEAEPNDDNGPTTASRQPNDR